eukprot:symbB.v1.2.024250.t1/scaffold2281.1/size83474/3
MSAWSRRALQEAEPLLGSHHQLVRQRGILHDFRPEVLPSTASFAMVLLFLEVGLAKMGFYVVGSAVPFLEIMANCSYKYVQVTLMVIARITTGPNMIYWLFFAYFSTCAAWAVRRFLLHFEPSGMKEQYGVAPSAMHGHIILGLAVAQLPLCWLLTPSAPTMSACNGPVEKLVTELQQSRKMHMVEHLQAKLLEDQRRSLKHFENVQSGLSIMREGAMRSRPSTSPAVGIAEATAQELGLQRMSFTETLRAEVEASRSACGIIAEEENRTSKTAPTQMAQIPEQPEMERPKTSPAKDAVH